MTVHREHARDQVDFGSTFFCECEDAGLQRAHFVVDLFIPFQLLRPSWGKDTLSCKCSCDVRRAACVLGLGRDGGH